MITVKELRSLFNSCDNDFQLRFQKWEHGNSEDFMKRNHYPMPNLVSIQIKKVIPNVYKDHERIIHKIILDKSALTREEALKYLESWILDIAHNKIYVDCE